LVEPFPAERRPQDGMSVRDPLPGSRERFIVELFVEEPDNLLDIHTRRRIGEEVKEHSLLHR
jgi:hypothetical protein